MCTQHSTPQKKPPTRSRAQAALHPSDGGISHQPQARASGTRLELATAARAWAADLLCRAPGPQQDGGPSPAAGPAPASHDRGRSSQVSSHQCEVRSINCERLPRPVSSLNIHPYMNTIGTNHIAMSGIDWLQQALYVRHEPLPHCACLVLSNRGCMAPQRWPPQALVACRCSLSLSVLCVTERVSREHGIVPDGAADAPAAVGDVVESPDSHDIVLSN